MRIFLLALIAISAIGLVKPLAVYGQSGARTFDQYTWLTTHNSFVNYEDARWAAPNQSHGIRKQLENGVRGLMLDTYWFGGSADGTCVLSFGTDCYPPGVYLCHGGCSGFPGSTYALPRQSLTVALNDIGTWLAENPTEVVTIFLEDHTSKDQLRLALLGSPFAFPLIFDPASPAWNVHEKGWPTLQWMRASNKRLVIFTSKAENDQQFIRYQPRYSAYNYWSIGAGGANYACTRGPGSPTLSHKPDTWNNLFLMNHFRDVPSTFTAAYDNGIDRLTERVEKYCTPAANRLPNYVAVDFYELGSAKEFVNRLNAEWARLANNTPASSNAAPSSNASSGVTFYQHCNYGGWAVTLPKGNLDLNKLASLGVANDSVSSIRVAPGSTVTIYQHGGFGGASLPLTGDVPCLVSYNFNDALSSAVVTGP